MPAYLDPNLQNKDLPTGVCFASGGSGLDNLTSSLTVQYYYYFLTLVPIYLYLSLQFNNISIFMCIICAKLWIFFFSNFPNVTKKITISQLYRCLINCKTSKSTQESLKGLWDKIISNSLFLLSAGNNDIALTYLDTPSRAFQYNISIYISMLVSWTSAFIKVRLIMLLYIILLASIYWIQYFYPPL